MNNSTVMHKPGHFIPERFQKIIAIHVVKNFMVQDFIRPPLLLGIHGPSGIGKTYQCELVLQAMKVKSFLISGGQLESHDAGEPAKLVREAYLNASRCIQERKVNAAVVLINDIDTGLGDWGEMVQYTVNRQTVFGELMHLVDYPTSVEGRQTQRIPIIITGNDFSKLYEPLVRAGRMTAFKWEPTNEEKVNIVVRIFPELSEDSCRYLVQDFDSQPIAFFSHVRDTLTDDIVWKSIKTVGIEKVFDYISNGKNPDVKLKEKVSYDLVLKAGQNLLESGKLLNHLRNQ